LLTAVMAKSIIQMQLHNSKYGQKLKPVQIMVPADLRRIFPSKTLRNFSLYALPKVTYSIFTRGSLNPELEPIFFQNMKKLGCIAELEVNGAAANLEKYLTERRLPVFKASVFCYNK